MAQPETFEICFYRREDLSCLYFYRVKRYVYKSISFALESKIIIYVAINLALVLQQHRLTFSRFATPQVEGRTAFANNRISYVKSAL